jgi:hypothetical protein
MWIAAVQGFALPTGSDITVIGAALIASGHPGLDVPCHWQAVAMRPAPWTMADHALGSMRSRGPRTDARLGRRGTFRTE